MNTNDDHTPRGDSLFRWYAHPLTTLIVVVLLALLCAVTFGTAFALTVLAGAVSIITKCAQAYRPNDPAT
ncbi:hypothetical protein [Prescottella equi]